MNVLTFTTLYPNQKQPRHGIFIEQRLRHLVGATDIQLKVVAPVPWFPLKNKCFGQYGLYADVPESENRFEIEVHHPKYLVLPKIGMSVTPLFLALSGLKKIRALIKNGFKPDIIDAHYVYPDGVAAAIIGKWLKIPVIITARGSDINVLPQYTLPRKMIQWATKKAAMNITVSNALKVEMQKLGVPSNKIDVLRNGVDLDTFNILPEVRQNRQGDNLQLISVGNLIELKGHHLVIEALKKLPNVELTIVGEGPMESTLKKLAINCNVADRVHFLGYQTHQQLAVLYNQVDLLVLASSREGMPNVLLEAMACGTPVIATNVGGVIEVVTKRLAGIVIPRRSHQSIKAAIEELSAVKTDVERLRCYAKRFSWESTSEGIGQHFNKIADQS